LATKRKAAHKKEDLKLYFKEFNDTIIKHKFNLADIYYIDKIRTVITHLLAKTVYLTDPNNRESLTAVETVCANNNIIPFMLILKSDVLLKQYFKNDLENNTLLITK
jgi:steroid 5-alpha reductase family enzyme